MFSLYLTFFCGAGRASLRPWITTRERQSTGVTSLERHVVLKTRKHVVFPRAPSTGIAVASGFLPIWIRTC